MASIGSKGLNDFLYDWLQIVVPDAPTWIGGKSGNTGEDWSWTDGSRWSYTNWGPGQPSGGYGDGSCVHINWNGGQGYWADSNCDNEYSYFCSMTPQISSASTPAIAAKTVSVEDCPSDESWPFTWKVYGNMCYSLGNIEMDWNFAKEQCDTGVKYHTNLFQTD